MNKMKKKIHFRNIFEIYGNATHRRNITVIEMETIVDRELTHSLGGKLCKITSINQR